jgi:hypothetical protein
MSPPDPWDGLRQHLTALRADAKYRRFKPIFDSVDALAGAGPNHPSATEMLESARILLEVVTSLQAKSNQGTDLRALVSEVQRCSFYQPGWNVTGPVNQANRDLVNNIVIKIFNDKGDELTIDAQSVLVPTVLVVMTHEEAAELVSGSAFASCPVPEKQTADFQPLLDLLKANLHGWPQRYHPHPADWRPPNAPNNETIGALINRELNEIYMDKRFDRPLVADFVDVRRVNDKDRRQLLRDLREKGCLVVIDAISMHHPALLRHYHASLLEASPRASPVRLVPLVNAIALVRQMRVALEWSIVELEFDRRRLDKYDEDSCRDFSDFDEFPKWFYNQVKKILPGAAAAPSGILREIRQQ